MKGQWFGSQKEIFEFPDPPWFRAVRMTATAILYTQFGFAIAADGRQLLDQRTRDTDTRDGESDQVQKIFEIEGEHMALACITQGHVANRDGSWNLARDLRERASLLRGTEFTSCREFLGALSSALEHTIESGRQSGILE